MFLELKAGGIDHMGLSPLQYQRLTNASLFKTNFNKFRYPAFSYTYLGYNLQDPKFKDKRVRQAIAHAIDKKSIIQGVLLGLGRPATGPFPPESWAYDKGILDYTYDTAAAKRLLAEAGWKDSNGDGLLDKGGAPFEFTVLTNQGNEERAKSAEIIQQNLAKIGIKMKIKVVEWQALLHEFIDKKKFDAIILGWGLGRDPDAFDIWHSSKTKEGEFNFVSYNNPKVDTLLLQGRETCDQEKRKAIYHEIHRLIAEDQPYTFLYYPESLPIVHKRFQGIKPSPIGIWYNFKDWTVPANWKTLLK
jgi:peptide/nickel transport system substrate-binding protein